MMSNIQDNVKYYRRYYDLVEKFYLACCNSTNKSFMPLKPKIHKKVISNSLIHSSYSPLSNYDDLSQTKNRDMNNYTDNNNHIYINFCFLYLPLINYKNFLKYILFFLLILFTFILFSFFIFFIMN